ncbi:carbohydrate ABC transporter permease [Paenibacillus koleovorans]|uniref:carbohydrate ABC transporter permease n=1 Tax=Paenibacillus koleovorans TaxID=121608 RepID=UPI000FDA87FA|nr:carbohydrate ABC transporter permease [Paenibacillus koleovorans]
MKTSNDRIIEGFIALILFAIGLTTIYPFIYVFSMSISAPEEVLAMRVWLWPRGFSLESYGMLFENNNLWRGYYNTIWYTVVGTAINIFVTVTFAYPLSRRDFFARGFFMILLAVTMFFSGGLIPDFLLIQKLGLYDTRWAIVLPAAMSAWIAIMTRVYFQTSIPDGLTEAAKIDGCSDIGILARVVLPISMPIISVIALYSAVGFWNSYFSALIYLPSAKLQPLQVYLMNVLIKNSPEMNNQFEDAMAKDMFATQLKYCIIMVSIIPIICSYPLLQKYFVKGAVVGAIKE